MEIKHLEKAQKLYERIKELTEQIIKLDQLAEVVATKPTSIKFSLKVNELEKKEEKKNILDSDGSLIMPGLSDSSISPWRIMFNIGNVGSCGSTAKTEYDHKQSEEITDVIAIEMIGVLIRTKSEARDLAMKQLEKLGVKIN